MQSFDRRGTTLKDYNTSRTSGVLFCRYCVLCISFEMALVVTTVSEKLYASIFRVSAVQEDRENGGSKLFRNVGQCIPMYKASILRRLESS